MFISALLVLLSIHSLTNATYWDCYDQKCEGRRIYSGFYIACDNEYNTCGYNYTGKN